MPFVFAGMALGRLDLTSAAVRARLAVLGPALAVLGYGGSWLAMRAFPRVARVAGSSAAWWSDTGPEEYTDSPAGLLVARPHSETTLSVLANTGVAITVIVAAVALTQRHALARLLAAPVVAVGSMSLTAYVYHVVVIWYLGPDELPVWPSYVLFGLIVSVAVPALAWRQIFRRGPLESLLHRVTGLARYVR
ncbi:DUF418 domain-containing protein [Streptomyces sp. B1866]|uniref:DUF418 domain-containing protein n=1 Tax=Streptomyces sp. B1866 TaxID=3075431 RepID=UPI0028910848|nr:DUF418 domain-containing protein [Streptomyces sp. B1866]MDT3398918.1 DUF418 domain-containing protein [Streptomyces sp. B1866]